MQGVAVCSIRLLGRRVALPRLDPAPAAAWAPDINPRPAVPPSRTDAIIFRCVSQWSAWFGFTNVQQQHAAPTDCLVFVSKSALRPEGGALPVIMSSIGPRETYDYRELNRCSAVQLTNKRDLRAPLCELRAKPTQELSRTFKRT